MVRPVIKGLDHVGIAVNNLESATELWQRVAGAVVDHRETVREQRVEVVMLRVGLLRVELIQPTSDDSPVAKFLATRGEGIHHIALGCDSAQLELDRTMTDGVRLIDKVVRMGAEHSQVGFVHPRSLAGVLLEFVDHAGQT
jgi:methylmalonyl-CoA/ethylmalonyl-CoA epimerase